MEKIINPFALFCLPAQLFLLLILFDICYIFFITLNMKKAKQPTLKTKIFGFLLFCLAGLGWSFIINYVCGYQEYIAWGLAAIPLLLYFIRA